MKKGILIAFEGIDGTGKSTQLHQLAEYLRQQGLSVIETREPTDGKYGLKIRDLYLNRKQCTPEEEVDLFVKDRQQHVRDVILPALGRGDIVLTDRYYFSTAAYQGAVGCDSQDIFARNSFAPEPDLVILLTMDPEKSKKRIQELRQEQLNDFEKIESLRKVADLFASFTHQCIVRIDAGDPFDTVQANIRNAVRPLLHRQGNE